MIEDKILFRSKDGQNFELYIDGRQIDITRGIAIFAENGEIEVKVNFVIVEGYKNIK
jgi:hypothetical protein